MQYEYDALDRLVKVTDREGKETSYTYDAAHQVTEIQNKDAKGKTISIYRSTYDLSGYSLIRKSISLSQKGRERPGG